MNNQISFTNFLITNFKYCHRETISAPIFSQRNLPISKCRNNTVIFIGKDIELFV